MSRLRVLWLSHFIPYPPLSGAVQRSYQLLKRIAEHHEVTVLALNRRALLGTPEAQTRATQAVESLGIRIQVFRPAAESSRARWIGMVAASALGQRPFTVNWLASASFARAVLDHLESGGVDLVHVDTISLMDQVRSPGIPLILNHHNIESQMLLRRAKRTPSRWRRFLLEREGRKLAALEGRVCPLVATNLVVSALDGERLNRVAPRAKWKVVENGVEVHRFAPSTGGDPHELVFSGTMGWYPNEDAMRYFLEQIWPRLIHQDPLFRLTIVGRGPSKALKDLALKDSRIALTGEVPDVRPFLYRAGIYVCPIRDGGGTRLKVLEALASGLPLVATTLAMEGLATVPGRHYIPAETSDEFVEGILRLRDDGSSRRSLGEAGRKLVSDLYTWEVSGLHLDHAFREVAAMRGGAGGPDQPAIQGQQTHRNKR